MKKLLIVFVSIILILIVAIVLVPFLFKDEIKTAVDEAIAENINAQVYYDEGGFSLSILEDFPNLTLTVNDFGIVGNEPFEKDTLVSIASFSFGIDIMSAINGEQIKINTISLDQPEIMVLVLPDGTANYDIAMPSDTLAVEEEPVDTSATAFNISIKSWAINNANIVYYDENMSFFTTLSGLTHTGSGDFSQDLFDIVTSTHIDSWNVSMEDVEYLSNKMFNADITLAMDLPNAKYTFKDNKVSLNNFGIGFDGYVAMPGEDIEMDLTYSGKDISIKSLLSMIPGVYHEYLDGVETDGNISFEGYAKGVYNENMLPDVNAKLNVDHGMFKYAEYPVPVEDLTIRTELNVPGDNMDNMTFNMSKFSMLLDGEVMEANLFFANLQNYTWDFGMHGNLDFEKLLKIVPIEGMDLKGLLNADFSTSGNMKLVDEEKYDELPASGSLSLTGFEMVSEDLPQGFKINKTTMDFSTTQIDLKEFDAMLGKSDMQMNGSLSNFIAFALDDNEVLKGELNFTSNKFDLNEWMTEEETDGLEEEVVEDSLDVVTEALRIPKSIDFKLQSKIHETLYDNMVIEDMDGLITVKDGIASLNNIDFHLLDGDFVMNGTYNSVVEEPVYDFGFDITDLSISKSYETFNTVQTLAPVAKNVDGKFSAELKLAGSMGVDMMPLYDDMYGKGVVKIKEAALKGDELMKAISAVSKASGDEITMKDVKLQVEIKDGRLYVEPFDVKMSGQNATIYGSNGVDGSVDYNINSEIKTGEAGSAVNAMLGQYTGGANLIGETMVLKLKMTGTYDKPKVSILGTETADGKSAKQAATDAAKAELDKQKKIAEAKAKEELAKQQKAAEAKAKEEVEKQQKIAEEKAKKAADKAKEDAKKKLKKLF